MANDMSELLQLVVFRLDHQRYALPLSAVARIVRAVEIMPLPGAPPIVLGAINMQGALLPVLNVRRRFSIPEREIRLGDHFLIARTDRGPVALAIDDADGVIERKQSAVVAARQIAPGLGHFDGVAPLDDGLVLIHDLHRFLAVDEACTLDAAMQRTESCPR